MSGQSAVSALGLVCKRCVLEMLWAHMPVDIDALTHYGNSEALRAHMNACHEDVKGLLWKGTEMAWPGILEESHGLAAGFLVSAGDLEVTHHEFLCLRCGLNTTDPVIVETRQCPGCGRDFRKILRDGKA